MMSQIERLAADELSVRYGANTALDNVSIPLPEGKLTAIIGPNACGKSTLLRSLARLQTPHAGRALLDGQPVHKLNSRRVAQSMAIMTQSPIAPEGILVRDLVARGRTPYQSPLRQWSKQDADAVDHALRLTGMDALADRPVDQLSGGQRQRVWIAMTLAQDTGILLFDEPTTYLDLPHQIELLTLICNLKHQTDRSIVMVLHDINLAARYADHIIAMKDGQIITSGPADEVIIPERMAEVFGLHCQVIADPLHGTPHIIPM